MEVEIWRDICGYTGKYQISNLGNVRSLDRFDSLNRFKSGSIRKISTEKDGYSYITLIGDNSKSKSFFIHRLVAMSFEIPGFDKIQINHIDGDKSNNKISNLEWVTASENSIHALKLGLRKSGEDHPLSKLSNAQVLEIPNLLKIGYSLKKISILYNVSYSTIKNISRKHKWKYLNDNLKD